MILADTGYPGQFPLLIEAMKQAGFPLEKLVRVIITHQDLDHIGSLPVLLAEGPPSIEVWAHELEKPFIEGERDC